MSYAFDRLDRCQSCIDCIAVINQIIQKNNAIIHARSNNPYKPVSDKLKSFAKKFTELATLLRQLEEERVKHNTSVTDTEPIIQELNKINDEIAHYDVIEDVLKLSVQEIERENAEDAYIANNCKY